MTKYAVVKMVSHQVDVPTVILKRVNLVSLAGAVSKVWQYFGFKTKEEKVLEPLQVNINLSLHVCMRTMAHLCI